MIALTIAALLLGAMGGAAVAVRRLMTVAATNAGDDGMRRLIQAAMEGGGHGRESND